MAPTSWFLPAGRTSASIRAQAKSDQLYTFRVLARQPRSARTVPREEDRPVATGDGKSDRRESRALTSTSQALFPRAVAPRHQDHYYAAMLHLEARRRGGGSLNPEESARLKRLLDKTSRRLVTQDRNYDVRRSSRCLVLPDPQDAPSHLRQHTVRVSVTGRVGSKFRGPPPSVGARLCSMDRASVPETAINHDGDPGTSERDVDRPTPLPGNRVSNSVTQPTTVELAAKRYLGGRVLPPCRRHPAADRR